MERFGAEPGAAFSVHESECNVLCLCITYLLTDRLVHDLSPVMLGLVEHISLAALFFFLGLVGIALETTYALDAISTLAVSPRGFDAVEEKPPSWHRSFNPFPALCIGIVGVLRSASHLLVSCKH